MLEENEDHLIKVRRDRADNTETISSPHTFKGAPVNGKDAHSQIHRDNPIISGMHITPSHILLGDPSPENGSLTNSTRTVNKVSFEVKDISAPIANLIRRAILTEVPTMAFDRILIEKNDGVVLDELLSHRIGMLPLVAPVDAFKFISVFDVLGSGAGHTTGGMPLPTVEGTSGAGGLRLQCPDPSKMLMFELDVVGDRSKAITVVYSSQLKWVPLPNSPQTSWKEGEDVYVVHGDVPLAKLGPGQRIQLKAFAIKGIGKSHTKWSPASACFYRFNVQIRIDNAVLRSAVAAKMAAEREGKGDGDDDVGKLSDFEARVRLEQDRLLCMCPGVFGTQEKDGIREVVVVNPSKCTMSRNCLHDEIFEDAVTIYKEKYNIEFFIESMGQYAAEELVPLAMKVFAERCRALGKHLEEVPPQVTNSHRADSSVTM
eukprot:Tbor_TRINITY_DN3898_c0_g1::TRINITY_DN3898_c0_g1_i1::g.5560::m.5560/K03027/RPC40, POLR1C; DNA-directed RNA polymerases I and III subunit RPAC1